MIRVNKMKLQVVKLYPIFLDSVISTELHCDVSPKGSLDEVVFHFDSILCLKSGCWFSNAEESTIPHPFLVILAPVKSDPLFWSWVTFFGVRHHPEQFKVEYLG